MIALSFKFLAGRYHATPWANHVNEGTVEWPPSPWRLLRALVAGSYKVRPPLGEARVTRAIAPLRELPVFALPPSGHGHTRHYMPAPTPTKVFDAFAVPAGELVVIWPNAEASPETLADLDRIVAHVGYLGRAESWVEARRLEEWHGTPNARPRLASGPPAPEDVRLLALAPDDAYASWLATLPKEKNVKHRPPATWWGALHADTGALASAGWSRPPGTREVVYAVDPQPPAARRSTARTHAVPTIARFELRSAVLPWITETLSVGERARQALIRCSDGLSLFAGKDATARPLVGHGHAFYLPVDDDGDGQLDHLIVAARDGFDAAARAALERLQRVWGHGGHDVAVTLLGLGGPTDFNGPPARGASPSLARARVWASRTPFVLPRHVKHKAGRVVHGPDEQLRFCLRELGLPTPILVEPLAIGPRGRRWWEFRRRRWRGGGARGGDAGYGFRVTFAEPVAGPIAVGYGAHLGLGQLAAL